MKFKERRGNVFVFDGGYDSEEMELVKQGGKMSLFFKFKDIYIKPSLEINTEYTSKYKDIQTAVNLMTILKDDGLV